MKDFHGDKLISAHINQASFDVWRKINDNPINTTIYFCDEECCLFRWSKCETKNKDGTCDKLDRYDYGEEFYPEQYEETK